MKKTIKEATQFHFDKFQLSDKQFAAINKMQINVWREEEKDIPKLRWYQKSQLFFSLAGAAVLVLVVGTQWINLPRVGDSPTASVSYSSAASVNTAYNKSLMESGLTIREQIDRQLTQQNTRLNRPIDESSLSKKVSYEHQSLDPITTLRRQIASQIAYNHNKNLALEIRTTNIERINEFYEKLDFTFVKPQILQGADWQLLGGRYGSIQQRLAAHMKLFNKKNKKIYSLYQYQLRSDSILRDFPEPWQVQKGNVLVTLWVEKGALHAMAGNN